jgi:hypothetical protein
VATPIGWVTSTFSADANEEDVVKARSLNITRIAAVVAPVLAGIATAIADFAKKEPFDDPGFQRQLVFVMVAFIALVTVADIIGRSVATGRATAPASVVLPGGVPASLTGGENHRNIEGTAVAFRTSAAGSADQDGEYLFVRNGADGDLAVSWELGSKLEGVGT